LATVTPSLVSVGLPNLREMTTLRPRGPSVTLTACDMVLTPRRSAARASSLNCNCLDMATFRSNVHESSTALGAENAEDVLLLHDQVLLAVQLDLAARILAKEDAVALLHVEGDGATFVAGPAGSDGDDLALLRLFLGAVGNEDAAVLLLLLGDALHEQAVMQRAQRRLGCPGDRGDLSHGAGASTFLCWGCGVGSSQRGQCTTKIVQSDNLAGCTIRLVQPLPGGGHRKEHPR